MNTCTQHIHELSITFRRFSDRQSCTKRISNKTKQKYDIILLLLFCTTVTQNNNNRNKKPNSKPYDAERATFKKYIEQISFSHCRDLIAIDSEFLTKFLFCWNKQEKKNDKVQKKVSSETKDLFPSKLFFFLI